MRELQALFVVTVLATLLAACAARSPSNRQAFQNNVEVMRPYIFQ